MRSIFSHFKFLVILAVMCKICEGVRKNIFESAVNSSELVASALNLYIPTVYSESEKCRDHSLFYLEQLKDLKLWATEMFDASAKFPSGLLYGSTYNFGNFDECLEVQVPYDQEEFKGKYCMAKITIDSVKYETVQKNLNWEMEDYKNYFNVSAKEKLSAYAHSTSRTKRNEYHLAFCLPSSCSHDDLKYSLNSIIDNLGFESFKIDIDVKQEDCQTEDDQYKLSNGDIIFVSLFMLYMVIVVIFSVWHKIAVRNKYESSGTLFKIAQCLAVGPNTRKVLRVRNPNANGLDSIAGLKVISMFLIIFGHRCMFNFGSPLQNPKFMEQMYQKVEAAIFLNGPIIVDSFFVIAGFLATYLMLDKLDSKKLLRSIPYLYVHRVLRILPTYGLIIAFYSTLFLKFGSGPFWKQKIVIQQERCSQNWWTNILFINNYVNTDNICMMHSWFVACDIHYFLITPLLVYLLQRKLKLGLATIGILIVAGIITSSTIVYVNNYDAILLPYIRFLDDPVLNESYKNMYIRSHMRANPYLLGILFGLAKYKIKCSGYKIPKHVVYSGWIATALIMLTTVYSGSLFYLPNGFRNRIFAAFYTSAHHITWALGIGWMILAVTEGHGDLIKPLLIWKPFVSFSRLTYSAFLIHPVYQIYTVAILRSPIYANILNTLFSTVGDLFVVYVLALIINIFFESPIVQLEKILLKRQSDKEEKSRQDKKYVEANISRETFVTIA